MSSQIQPSPQQSSNPDTPPPPYSIRVPEYDSRPGPPSSQHSPQNTMPGHYPHREPSLFSSSAAPQFLPPSHFGPTPLMQAQPTLGLLPYYDPRSPYSVEAATRRARWRFIGAALWAMGLFMFFLAVVTLRGLREM